MLQDASRATSQDRTTQIYRDEAWKRYQSALAAELDEPIFGGKVSIRDVYISLRAYSENVQWDKDIVYVQRNAKWLHDEMRSWATSANVRHALRIMCGGPGYGKSSFARVFCEVINSESHLAIKALYIPLQRLDLESGISASEQINSYLRKYGFDFCNPFNPRSDETFLLVLDGVDELAMQGEEATKAAIKFVSEVGKEMQPINTSSTRLRCLVSGRDIMIQAVVNALQLEDQVWHLIPYLWREDDHLRSYTTLNDRNAAVLPVEYDYRFSNKLLAEDQRSEWWVQYGKATGRDYDGVPPALKIENLNPLTALPLLNYLLALSYEGNDRIFGKETTRNDIYHDLLARIHQRDWSHSGTSPRNPHTKGMPLTIFVRVLEEVALAAWHSGDTRSARVEDIEKACERANLLQAWQEFRLRGQEGLTRILTAFYIRWQEFGPGVVEFTHKSFGDYLAARAIVNAWSSIATEFSKSGNIVECLLRWLQICGQRDVNVYIFEFIRDEIRARAKSAPIWQRICAQLLQHTIDYGIQADVLLEKTSLKELSRQIRNAQAALLIIHSCCGGQTKQRSDIDWRHSRGFYMWLIQLQSENPKISLVNELLGYLSFGTNEFSLYARGLDLDGGSFEGSKLINIDLSGSILTQASFERSEWNAVKMDGAEMAEANLERAKIGNSRLRYAILANANFREADLESADLSYATLTHAIFENARLSKANLYLARLQSANLSRAHLDGADMRNATLVSATLIEVDCCKARMQGANLYQAKLSGSNFEHADLSGADLSEADLSNTNLNWTNFSGATLHKTHLTRARLAGASLEGVDLSTVVGAANAEWHGAEIDAQTRLPKNFPYGRYEREVHPLKRGTIVFRLIKGFRQTNVHQKNSRRSH